MIFRLSWICLLEDSFKLLCVHEAHIQILWTSSYILTQMLMAVCILSILVLESDTWYLQLCSFSRLLGLFRVHSNFRIVHFISGKITIAIWIGIILEVQTDLENIDCCSSVTQVCPILCKLQNARPPCSSQSPEVCPSSCPLYWWCHPATSSSDALLFFCLQFFPASGTFSMSWMFTSDAQDTGASASVSVLTMSIQCWFPLRLTGLIYLLSNGLSGIFSSTTVWRHQFFAALFFMVQLSQV